MYMGASAATNTTGHPLRQIKIPWQWVSCAEQRWWTFIDMVALKKWVGLGLAVSVPGNEAVKTAARLAWGRIDLAWPQRLGR